MIDKKLAEAFDEKFDKKQRKLNLIMVNLPESTETEPKLRQKDEILKIKTLISKACPDLEKEDICDPVRLGRIGGNKLRMLKFKISCVENKHKIMKGVKEMNRNLPRDKQVFVNPDYSPLERAKYKHLRDELKQRVDSGETNIGKSNGQIVPVKWLNKTGLVEQHKNK